MQPDKDSIIWWNCEQLQHGVNNVDIDDDSTPTMQKVYLHTERRENLYMHVKWEENQHHFMLGLGIDREKSADGYVFEIRPMPST